MVAQFRLVNYSLLPPIYVFLSFSDLGKLINFGLALFLTLTHFQHPKRPQTVCNSLWESNLARASTISATKFNVETEHWKKLQRARLECQTNNIGRCLPSVPALKRLSLADFSWFGPAMLLWCLSCSLRATQAVQIRCAPHSTCAFFGYPSNWHSSLEIHDSLLKTDVYIHDRCSMPLLFTGGYLNPDPHPNDTSISIPRDLKIAASVEFFRPRSSSQGPC